MSRLFVVFCAGLAGTLFAGGGPAWAQSECPREVTVIGNTKVQSLNGTHGCFVSIYPNDPEKAFHRYTINERGTFQFFSSFDLPGPQKGMRTSGSKTFFLFPRNGKPSARIDNATQTLEITLPTGDILKFNPGSPKTASAPAVQPSWPESQPASSLLPRCARAILPSNGGGCELVVAPSAKVLVLDTGISMGQDNILNRALTSKFIDPHGASCVVTNSEIFSYADRYEPVLKLLSDGDLARFLATRCPTLKLTGILPAPDAPGGGGGGVTPVEKAK